MTKVHIGGKIYFNIALLVVDKDLFAP